ncbi:MAG: cellulose biosynthesis protein BcsS [Hyphomicrobiaceae bacterium]
MWRRIEKARAGRGAVLAACILAGVTEASSQEALERVPAGRIAPAPAAARQMFEVSAGADGTGPSWSIYSGLTAALFGDLRDNGVRLRLSGGYGRYRYTRPFFDEGRRRHLWPEFFGEQTSVDALIGYHWAWGPTTLKAYGGLTQERHRISPGPDSPLDADGDNAVQGTRSGIKLVVETWTRLADWGFFQADANWSQPFEAYGGRIRLGHNLSGGWSVGLEAAAFGNLNHDGGRAGAFARFAWDKGEISLSAGLDGDLERIGGGYASIAALTRF